MFISVFYNCEENGLTFNQYTQDILEIDPEFCEQEEEIIYKRCVKNGKVVAGLDTYGVFKVEGSWDDSHVIIAADESQVGAMFYEFATKGTTSPVKVDTVFFVLDIENMDYDGLSSLGLKLMQQFPVTLGTVQQDRIALCCQTADFDQLRDQLVEEIHEHNDGYCVTVHIVDEKQYDDML